MIPGNHLVIHVGGYRPKQKRVIRIVSLKGLSHSLPDRLVPEPIFTPGSAEWFEQGWAVGDNPYNRYCKFALKKPMRQFTSFEDASEFKSNLTVKRAKLGEIFTLVYVEEGRGFHPVATQEDINEIESVIQTRQREAQHRAQINLPELDRLKSLSPKTNPLKLSLALAAYRKGGLDTVISDCYVSKSTASRYVKELKELGML